MQLFDVCTKRIYEIDGEKKAKWYRTGFMKTTERGSTYIRLFNQPDVDLYVFKKDIDIPVVQAEE